MTNRWQDTDRSLPEQPEENGKDSSRAAIAMEENSSALTLDKPLAVILNSPGKDSIMPGSVFSLSVTVSNRGRQSAIFEIGIDPISAVLEQWCASRQERLALGPGQSDEMVFYFRVPIDAIAGLYQYLVIVDAQEAYPEDTPIQFAQQIQVLPATQDTVRSGDPTFVLQPATSSGNPTIIQPGGALQVQVFVHNRSDRVDRLRLLCTDLPRSWYGVTYPQGIQGSGLIVDADSLNLNPGEQGLILLLITPPLDALAGNYVPTLRLYSENNPELMLLDLLYLQIPPSYLLQAELRTFIGRVKRQAGLFQVRLTNSGNTRRVIRLQAKNLDEDDLCTYTLDQGQIRLAPKETIGISLQAKPNKWWRRPVYGGGRLFNFSIDLEDAQQQPLPMDNLPGMLIWEPRPWWQFLPILALGILGILALAYWIWWLIFRTPPIPKVIQFAPEDTTYAAVNGDVVRVGWQINNVDRLQSIQIVGTAADGALLTRPEVYDFSQGIPSALQPYCVTQKVVLTCQSVRTNARKPGTYIFQLTTTPKPGRGATADQAKTSPVTIQAIPQPKIVAFASTQPIYQEPSPFVIKAQPTANSASSPATNPTAGTEASSPANPTANPDAAKVAEIVQIFGIQLNWSVDNPKQLKELRLIGRTKDGLVVSPLKTYDFSQGVPAELAKSCVVQEKLVCQNIKTATKKPGDYIFELTAIPQVGPTDPPEAKKTELIRIVPRPPQILELTVNGQPAQPKYLIPISQGQIPTFMLSWLVDSSEGTKVELLPAPGSVPIKGSIPIFLSPKPGSLTVTLQVTNSVGQQVVRSIALDTFDPTAMDPAAAAAAAAAAAIANAQQQQQSGGANGAANGAASGTPAPGAPVPSSPERLSPVELPPQFDRR